MTTTTFYVEPAGGQVTEAPNFTVAITKLRTPGRITQGQDRRVVAIREADGYLHAPDGP